MGWSPTIGPVVAPGLRTASTIAALILLLLPAGTFHVVSLFGGNIAISWSELLIPLLMAHLAASRAVHGSRPRLAAFAAVAGLMIVPILVSPIVPSAAAAYVDFASGVVGGFGVGYVWTLLPTQALNRIDVAAIASAIIISVQLFAGAIGASSGAIHASPTTDLGGSNYLAGILVVLAFAAAGRFRVTHVPRTAYCFLLIPIGAIITLLSRGGLVALAVGCSVLLWQRTRKTGPSLLLRRFAIVLLPFIANYGFARISTIRGQGIDLNVSVRYKLYRMAWNGYLGSPLTGQGWASFRAITLDQIGTSLTFAHNLPLSMLQIGGLCAVPTLVIIAKWTCIAGRHRPDMLPAIAAGIALSMTDPLFEGYAGGLVMWMVLYPFAVDRRHDGEHVTVASRAPAPHTWIQGQLGRNG